MRANDDKTTPIRHDKTYSAQLYSLLVDDKTSALSVYRPLSIIWRDDKTCGSPTRPLRQ